MPIEFNVLKPYKTLILAQVSGDDVNKIIVEPVILDFKSLLDFDNDPDLEIVTEGPTASYEVSRPDSLERDQMQFKFLHYTQTRAPGWCREEGGVYDTLNQLIVACQLKQQVAIFVSDPRGRAAATRWIKAGKGDGLGALKLLAVDVLNAAFVKGPTRTVWLSGIHAPVSVKADSKILSGLNLRDALDPLGDQTYYFTAARSRVPKLKLPVGVSPRGSRVWAGATSGWSDFVNTTASLLYHVEATTERDMKPLPVLAVPDSEAPKLAEAYEVHFLPPELLADDPDLDPEVQEKMERWAYQADLKIREIQGNSLQADVTMEGAPLGALKLDFDTSDVMNVKICADVTADAACPEDHKPFLDELKDVCQNAHWIKVWYESGHTLADGAIFEVRHRDQPFDGFHWADFADYHVNKEKFWKGSFPADALDKIGKEKSLFCWVRSNWPLQEDPYSSNAGWLACDDGAMEIADFIHLDVGGAVPVLTLIHVKGAHSEKKKRGISVSSYEVVAGQAVKNARFLDRLCLDVGLKEGLGTRIGQLVWHDGQASTREKMLQAIGQIGTSYRRMVVILQPEVTKSRLDAVRNARAEGKTHPDMGRVRQLDTLLLSAEASCHGLGAGLWVLADKV